MIFRSQPHCAGFLLLVESSRLTLRWYADYFQIVGRHAFNAGIPIGVNLHESARREALHRRFVGADVYIPLLNADDYPAPLLDLFHCEPAR